MSVSLENMVDTMTPEARAQMRQAMQGMRPPLEALTEAAMFQSQMGTPDVIQRLREKSGFVPDLVPGIEAAIKMLTGWREIESDDEIHPDMWRFMMDRAAKEFSYSLAHAHLSPERAEEERQRLHEVIE